MGVFWCRTLPFILLASACQSVAADKPVTAVSAQKLLLNTLIGKRIFPHIPDRCLYAEYEDTRYERYVYAVRYNQKECGGNSASNLVGWFAVRKAGGQIEYDDMSKPGEEAEFISLGKYIQGLE